MFLSGGSGSSRRHVIYLFSKTPRMAKKSEMVASQLLFKEEEGNLIATLMTDPWNLRFADELWVKLWAAYTYEVSL